MTEYSGFEKWLSPLKKQGMSEVVSTLILLVVAVLLSGVIAYYATNITTTRTATEEIQFSNAHVWVKSWKWLFRLLQGTQETQKIKNPRKCVWIYKKKGKGDERYLH